MKIKVEQRHIDRSLSLIKNRDAVYLATNMCPIANAIKEKLKTTNVRVERCNIIVNKRESVSLPLEVTGRIIEFDRIEAMEPFEFDLEIEV